MLHLDIVRSPLAHARIKSIDSEKALAIPGVLAVITGKDLEQYNLAWMPTLMGDTQMVLPVDTVKFDGQEVAAVLATDRYIAADGVNAVEVEYEPLPPVVDPFKALEPDSQIVREDKEEQSNHIWHWEVGDKESTDRVFRQSDVTVKEDIYIPRIHVSSIETCGCVAQWDAVNEKLTVYMTTQAPHAIRDRPGACGRTPGTGRAQDQGRIAGHRRWLRREGAGLSWIRASNRGIVPHRQPCEVGRGPHGEPDSGLLCP